MKPLIDWPAERARLAAAPDERVLEQELLAIADYIGPKLIGSSLSHSAWRALGVRVAQADLSRLAGHCNPTAPDPVVTVRRGDDPRRQRFTIAHETAHLLMGHVPRRRIGITRSAEEQLCDRFASRLLIPRADLLHQLRSRKGTPADIPALAARYGVSLSVTLAACGQPLAARGRLIFAASVRGHMRRPGEHALRALGGHYGPYLLPAGERLSSRGLADVEQAMRVRQRASGYVRDASVRLWRPHHTPRSGYAHGPATWAAATLSSGVALVAVDTTDMCERWYQPRARASAQDDRARVPLAV